MVATEDARGNARFGWGRALRGAYAARVPGARAAGATERHVVCRGWNDADGRSSGYVVHGVRKASKNFQPIRPNTVFVPRRATDPEFTVGFPEESVRRLKATRILNDDGTVNLETAKRLGWDQRPGWNEPERALPDPK